MAMSSAERQRRYRQRLKAGDKAVQDRRPKDRRSRPKRWDDAVQTLIDLQDHYRNWLDQLPQSLHGSVLHERLEIMDVLDLQTLCDIEVPRGYGRD